MKSREKHNKEQVEYQIDQWIDQWGSLSSQQVSPFFVDKVFNRIEIETQKQVKFHEHRFMVALAATILLLLGLNLITVLVEIQTNSPQDSFTEQVATEYQNLQQDTFNNYSLTADGSLDYYQTTKK
jgi:hypothetical protein